MTAEEALIHMRARILAPGSGFGFDDEGARALIAKLGPGGAIAEMERQIAFAFEFRAAHVAIQGKKPAHERCQCVTCTGTR